MTLTAPKRRKLRAMVHTCDLMLTGLSFSQARRAASALYGFNDKSLEDWSLPSYQHDPLNRAFVKAIRALSEKPRDVNKIVNAMDALMSLSDVEVRRVARATPGVPPRASNPRGGGETRERSDPPMTNSGVSCGEMVKAFSKDVEEGEVVAEEAFENGVLLLPGGVRVLPGKGGPEAAGGEVCGPCEAVAGGPGSPPMTGVPPESEGLESGEVGVGDCPTEYPGEWVGPPFVLDPSVETVCLSDVVVHGEDWDGNPVTEVVVGYEGEVVPFAGLPRDPEPGDAEWPWSLPEEADPRVVAVWDMCGGWRPPGSVREVGERLLEQRKGPRLLKPATWGAWMRGEVLP